MFNRLKKSLINVFGISSVEANGIIILFLILAVMIFSSVVWVHRKQDEYGSYREDKKLLDSLLSMMNADTAEVSISGNGTQNRIEPELFIFNPNTASLQDLYKLGIPSRIAERVVNYRNSGGRFVVRNDLSRIYGMPGDIFRKIRPYILLPDSIPPLSADTGIQFIEPDQSVPADPIDLNKADSSQLTRIKGIGPVLALRILKYRDMLGGYISVEQLNEIYGLKEPALGSVKEAAFIDHSFSPVKIRINFAEWKDLVHHPYIDKYLANAIIAFRDRSGPFHSVDDLRKINSINDSTISKISPYITF